jgi:acyl carrier protein
VKIRGYRVEPEEIETVLVTHPAVQSAAVVPVHDRASEHAAPELRLLAYLVLDRQVAPADAERDRQLVPAIRRFVEQQLASYMVPAFFTIEDTLPLTPSGKLDRRALRERAADVRLERPADPDAAGPRTAVERLLVAIWQEVLDLPRVAISDDFFLDLGGDSLRGTRTIAQIRDQLGISLPLEALFDAPTIASLADHLRTTGDGAALDERAEALLRVAQMSDDEVAAMLERDRAS